MGLGRACDFVNPVVRKAIGLIIVLLGLWEFGDIALPFVIGFAPVQGLVWNHIAVGVILMIAGAWSATTRDAGTAQTMDWIAAIAGAWLVIASFVLGSPVIAAGRWNDVVVGVMVVML